MAKKIMDMGYEATAVVCGKFFNCEDIYTLKEMAEMFGGEYTKQWEEDDKELVSTFNGDGFTFIGCVKLKEELADEFCEDGLYWEWAYVVRGKFDSKDETRIYLVVDCWDEARGQGKCRAYRYNLLTKGSWDYDTANRIYNKICGQAESK